MKPISGVTILWDVLQFPNSANTQFLNNVPADKFKHWIITKTSTHLKVVCNRVTVLNFNFATDYKPGSENSHQVWLKRCTKIRLRKYDESDLLIWRQCDNFK